jgi:predicted HicB family RNase H-like nuclease
VKTDKVTETSKITTTIRLDTPDHQRLSEIAKQEVRSVNNLVEYIIKKFLQDYQAP